MTDARHLPHECGDHHDVVRDFIGPAPTVTVLCGSTRFAAAFHRQNLLHTLAGHIVLSIGVDLRSTADRALAASAGIDVADPGVKERLDALHKRKIDVADEVFVINPGGYVGSSTAGEIRYAFESGKPVRWLEKMCDNTSVGAVITNEREELLLIERADGQGMAPPAGHAAEHGVRDTDALVTEVAEEVGLYVTSWTALTSLNGWRDNPCKRHPGLDGPGHRWSFYRAEAAGRVRPAPEEALRAVWAGRAALERLARVTVARAHGRVTGGPGLEAVWIEPLARLGLIGELDTPDAEAVDRITRTRI